MNGNEINELFNSEKYILEHIFFLEILPLEIFINFTATNKYFRNLVSGFYSERIFEERSKRFFDSETLCLRENMKWKEFYMRVVKFENRRLVFKTNQPEWYINLFKNKQELELKILFRSLVYKKEYMLLRGLDFEEMIVKYNLVNLMIWRYNFARFYNDVLLIHAIINLDIEMIKCLINLDSNFVPDNTDIECLIDKCEDEDNIDAAIDIFEIFSQLNPPIIPALELIMSIWNRISRERVLTWLKSKK